MTQDPNIILKGLHCCSRGNCDCDNCPYLQDGVFCRELESDSAELIQFLLEQLDNLERLNAQLMNDIDEKLKYILELEEMVGMPGE